MNITLDTLKENREEIIDMISEMVGEKYIKEGMSIIAKMVGYRGYEGYSLERFVKSSIRDSGIQDRIIMSEGTAAQWALEEKYAEMAKRQMKHI